MTERKILRITEPQGEPDVIECDGMAYVVRRTCRPVYFEGDTLCSHCRDYMDETRNFCGSCGALICDEAPMVTPASADAAQPAFQLLLKEEQGAVALGVALCQNTVNPTREQAAAQALENRVRTARASMLALGA